MKRFFTCPGSRKKPVRQAHMDDFGRIEVLTVGYDDIQADIQSYADSVDINNIVARFTAGDVSALNAGQPFYADVAHLPTNYPDLFNLMTKLRADFDQLSPAVRERFGNSFDRFIVASQSPDFESYFRFTVPVAPAEPGDSVPKEGEYT